MDDTKYKRQGLKKAERIMNEIQACGCAHLTDGKCEALDDPSCRHSEVPCPFYQTQEEAAASLERYNARMRTLPILQQLRYAEKYHKGLITWK